MEVLRAQRRRLGQFLVEQHGLSPQDLDEALALQQELGRPLGEMLAVMGLVSDGMLARALAQVHDWAATRIPTACAGASGR